MKILTNAQIEAGDYSINDVADLKMRFDFMIAEMEGIVNASYIENCTSVEDMATFALHRSLADHIPPPDNPEECGVLLCERTGKYICNCKHVA